MSIRYNLPIWKTAPLTRLLVPLVIGIVLQWYLQFTLLFILFSCAAFSLAFLLFNFLPFSLKFKIQPLQGLILNLVLLSFGLFITWKKDIRNDAGWYGNYYKDNDQLIVRITEEPVEKAKSNKAEGYVETLIQSDSAINCKGKILLYFSKDPTTSALHYGDIILINKNVQAIKNAGNPGEFDYEQYAAFQQTYHDVFLKRNDWILLNEKNINPFKSFIFSARQHILSVLRNNIKGNEDEAGIAEALLIGYTNDLDKELVQAYNNTGVPHIIAMSGMSLGLIYLILLWVFKQIPFIKKNRIMKMILLLGCLWLFVFLTGESASVLRSAVMLTCIVTGNGFSKKASVYNSLAASAFILLCFNPYYLWDVGFQISYLAIISIYIFQKPIYNWFYIENKWVNKLWRFVAITLAVQVLTFPICVYYFHQFPLLFLVTNLIVMPLSIIILFAELALLVLSFSTFITSYLGKITAWYIDVMNSFILWINSLARLDNLQWPLLSTIIIYTVIFLFAAWLINKNKSLLKLLLFCILFFAMNVAYNNWRVKRQSKMIVYNVPKLKAIDFVSGNNYAFIGDSTTPIAQLKSTRLLLELNTTNDSLQNLFNKGMFYQFANTRIAFIDKPLQFSSSTQKIDVDIIIISKSAKVYIPQLASVFNCNQYVADASNSLWKIDKWKKDCEKLHLPFYSIPNQGAYILNVE